MKVQFKVYKIVDSHGKEWGTVVEEASTDVQVCGMKNTAGEEIYFESEAYHLFSWCEENGLTFTSREAEIEI